MCKRLLSIGVLVLMISPISLGFGGLGSWGSGYAVQDGWISSYQSPYGQDIGAGFYQDVGRAPGYGGSFAQQSYAVGLGQTQYSPNAHVPCITDVHMQGALITGTQFSTAIGYSCQPYSNYQDVCVNTRQGIH